MDIFYVLHDYYTFYNGHKSFIRRRFFILEFKIFAENPKFSKKWQINFILPNESVRMSYKICDIL